MLSPPKYSLFNNNHSQVKAFGVRDILWWKKLFVGARSKKNYSVTQWFYMLMLVYNVAIVIGNTAQGLYPCE
jgi:hypothetical protein